MDRMKIGIIGAMREEVVGLSSMIDNKKLSQIAGMTFYEGRIKGVDVVVVECGIAKVNAAMCTQILISEFGVGALINTGVAGALNENLDINDIVVSTDAIQYDVDASSLGDPKGTIPRMETSIFKADVGLVDLAYESFAKEDSNYKVYKGRVVTGDKFIASIDEKIYLRETFNGYCCEMEGGAIAHVAHCNGLPFVIIRAISDKADKSADLVYEEFVKIAADRSKDMVLNILSKIS